MLQRGRCSQEARRPRPPGYVTDEKDCRFRLSLNIPAGCAARRGSVTPEPALIGGLALRHCLPDAGQQTRPKPDQPVDTFHSAVMDRRPGLGDMFGIAWCAAGRFRHLGGGILVFLRAANEGRDLGIDLDMEKLTGHGERPEL